MGTFFKQIFRLVALAFLIFTATACWMVYDGSNDRGVLADVALVTGHPEPGDGALGPLAKERLDRAIGLYRNGEFSHIVVSGASGSSEGGAAAAMEKYLVARDVPADAILEDRHGDHTQDTARNLAGIMRSHQFHSVMIVTPYYHMTRVDWALNHVGIDDIEKVHVGRLRKEDALPIAREVVALYADIGRVYLLPAVKKAGDEANIGMEKVRVDAKKAKETVDKKLDSLAK